MQQVNDNLVGIVGGGTMGRGIAQVCAAAGMEVVLLDVSQAALDNAGLAIRTGLERQCRKGTIDADAAAAALLRVQYSTGYEPLSRAAMVIEAATERLEAKLSILQALDDVVCQEAIIASNTSSISIWLRCSAGNHASTVHQLRRPEISACAAACRDGRGRPLGT